MWLGNGRRSGKENQDLRLIVLQLEEVLKRRRMVRAFDPSPIEPAVLNKILNSLFQAPSAGFTQGLEVLVLDNLESIEQFWSLTFSSSEKRSAFRWQGLFDAPVLLIPVVSPDAYAIRYGEPDKAASGLGELSKWNVPYWWVDGGMGVMAGLLRAVDQDLGALFFGLFENEASVLKAFDVPSNYRALGAIALGYPGSDVPGSDEPGRSASRPRRSHDDVIHRNRWRS